MITPNFTPPPDADSQAISEGNQYSSKQTLDLKRDAAIGDHRRSQGLKSHAYRGTVLILWVIMIAIALAVAVLAWHVLTAEGCRYLKPEEVGELKQVLVALLVSGLLADNARRLLN
jgi:hypothetical protein